MYLRVSFFTSLYLSVHLISGTLAQQGLLWKLNKRDMQAPGFSFNPISTLRKLTVVIEECIICKSTTARKQKSQRFTSYLIYSSWNSAFFQTKNFEEVFRLKSQGIWTLPELRTRTLWKQGFKHTLLGGKANRGWMCLWLFLIHPSLLPAAACVSHCCVQLFASPWTMACQAPLSMGFSRQEPAGKPLQKVFCGFLCWVGGVNKERARLPSHRW